MDIGKITFLLNDEPVTIYADPAESLLHLLRDQLGCMSPKEGCGRGECGACTVILDGKAVNSCLVPAGKAAGKNIRTIEGISDGKSVHPLQRAFVEKGAVQCGFCTSGMIMSAYALLAENPAPRQEEVKRAISGNLCRCSGYKQIEEAIMTAAEEMNENRVRFVEKEQKE